MVCPSRDADQAVRGSAKGNRCDDPTPWRVTIGDRLGSRGRASRCAAGARAWDEGDGSANKPSRAATRYSVRAWDDVTGRARQPPGVPMVNRAIAITGIGVVAPNGMGKEEFWRNCFAGLSGIRPISVFDPHPYRCRSAGELTDFTPEQFLGSQGLRTLDRTTRLALVAAKLAIDDAGLDMTETSRNTIGVVLGSTMGSIRSISEFDLEGLREGPRYVNPALFPNVVINSPASQVAIRFKLQGLNATIATGFTASLDAIGYALDMLRLGRATTVLVGGAEELCLPTFLGFYKLGFLATARNGAPPFYAPFHPQRCGALLGEGAAFVVLEPFEEAARRGTPIYAEVAGYGTAFHPASLYRYDPVAASATTAMQQALSDADVRADEVEYISASANSTKACDAMELAAVKTVFGARAARVPLSAVKAMVGESFSAAGALQVAATVGTLVHQQLPPTINWGSYDPTAERETVSQQTRSAPITTALVHALGVTGTASALVVRRGPGVRDA